MDIRIFSILILLLKSSDAYCRGIMNTIFVYDEYVCKEKVVCDEFLKQIELIKTFEKTPNMTDSFNPTAVICPGYHGRQAVRYYTHGHFVTYLDMAVKEYFWSLPNLARTFAIITPMVYRYGYHLPKSRTVIIIFTSTQDQRNLEMLRIFLGEIANQNGQVYAAGVGTDIEENVLRHLSSQPKKKNENYFLQFNPDILLRILRKERLDSLYCSTLDSRGMLDTTQSLPSTENSKFASGTTEPQPSIKPSSAKLSKFASGTTEPQPSIKPSSAKFSSYSSTSVVLGISSENENTKTSQRSRFKTSTFRSTKKSTTETISINDSWKHMDGEKEKIGPKIYTSIWKETKRLARIYGKYFMIGALIGYIGAMAPYWTFYPSEAKTKTGRKHKRKQKAPKPTPQVQL